MAASPPETLARLREVIQADPALARLAETVAGRMAADPAHDLGHAARVALWTLRLAPRCGTREVIAAALLHDAVNPPKDSPERKRASELSANLARELMSAAGFQAHTIDRVSEAIRTHSFSRGEAPTSELGCALQDADRLEALGALGICRTLSTGARLNARYFDETDPWASQRELDDNRFTVDHFFTKLLGLEATMQTEAGRAEARLRTRFMRAFLSQLGAEIGAPAPDGLAGRSRGSARERELP